MKSITVTFVLFLGIFSNTSYVLAQNPGDILINEVMQNPSMVSDANGEWFELYNILTHQLILMDGR